MQTVYGRQLTAARALAGITIADLAREAGVTMRTVHRLERTPLIHFSDRLSRGRVTRSTWESITTALRSLDVELVPAGKGHGAGARWISPAGAARELGARQ